MAWQALVGAGISHAFNLSSARREQRAARTNRAFQERMSNTAYQRQVKDLKAAGLNPILGFAKGAGPGASTPSGSKANVQPTSNTPSYVLDAMKTLPQILQMNANTANQLSQAVTNMGKLGPLQGAKGIIGTEYLPDLMRAGRKGGDFIETFLKELFPMGFLNTVLEKPNPNTGKVVKSIGELLGQKSGDPYGKNNKLVIKGELTVMDLLKAFFSKEGGMFQEQDLDPKYLTTRQGKKEIFMRSHGRNKRNSSKNFRQWK
jgi:hypothetical protein